MGALSISFADPTASVGVHGAHREAGALRTTRAWAHPLATAWRGHRWATASVGGVRCPTPCRSADVDECSVQNGGCEHKCQNTAGSFTCSCNSGYKLNANGLTCDGVSLRVGFRALGRDAPSSLLQPLSLHGFGICTGACTAAFPSTMSRACVGSQLPAILLFCFSNPHPPLRAVSLTNFGGFCRRIPPIHWASGSTAVQRGPGGCLALCRALLEGEGCDRRNSRAVQSGHRGREAVGGRLLAVGNAVGAGVGVWERLWDRVKTGVVGGRGVPPLKRFPGFMC